jgi:hypothetical protein
MLYKFALYNRPKFRKVCHFCYIFFLLTNKGVKLGGILEKISKKIGYKFQTLIHYRYVVILVGSYGL